MKFSELREKSIKELYDLLNEERIRLGNLRFKLANNQLKNVREIKETKKNIARILTEISKRKNLK